MKRALFVIPFAVLALAGCGTPAVPADASTPVANPVPTFASLAAQAEAAIVDSSAIGDGSYKARFDQEDKAPSLKSCNVTLVDADSEGSVGWMREWDFNATSGLVEYVMALPNKMVSGLLNRGSTSAELCTGYTVAGGKTTALTPKTIIISGYTPAGSYVSCTKTTRSGHAAEFACAFVFGSGSFVASVAAWGATQEQAEEILMNVMELSVRQFAEVVR